MGAGPPLRGIRPYDSHGVMSKSERKPLIGVPVNTHHDPKRNVMLHGVGEKYISAVSVGADAVPMLIPALADSFDMKEWLGPLDGLMLTGGRSNIEPHHYDGPPFPDDEICDPARDATVLPMIRAAIDQGVPVFGVCRGFQEINVALGGTLHYRVHELPGMMDHRMRRDGDMDYRYELRHTVSIAPGSYCEELANTPELMVNSLHGQGINRLAPGLVAEAMAPDGLIEAVRLEGAKRFTVGVQWHAEWRHDEHPLSGALLAAFGQAARAYAAQKPARVSVP